uniref:SET domain-containing protein n=1 Tax=Globisporangium ultimum (strain ATCC 200006 / CBS 805.95 / DAOM BR144) TaxID=431595 RepID=K3X8I1_GLOUD
MAARTQAQKEERFLQWPVVTENGLRGVVTLEDIATNEPMLQIPEKLVISERRCWEDPRLKDILEANRDVFSRDDPVLALFLVQEMLRGDDSFFEPYLSILPYPESIQDWSDDELAELRDRRLVDAAKRRRSEIDTFYDRVFTLLDTKYPGVFPREQYTRDKFAFAWKTIQARTFGRRLPWTALVPFADCLNHRNVATKYDFNVDNNGMFRLFPSSTNTYAAGTEVFNSYGRRSNFQLLLDYGFALLENEWDYVDIDLPKDAMGKRFPFLRRLQLDGRSSLEDLFPVSVLGSLSSASSPPTSPSESEAKAAERDALQAGSSSMS